MVSEHLVPREIICLWVPLSSVSCTPVAIVVRTGARVSHRGQEGSLRRRRRRRRCHPVQSALIQVGQTRPDRHTGGHCLVNELVVSRDTGGTEHHAVIGARRCALVPLVSYRQRIWLTPPSSTSRQGLCNKITDVNSMACITCHRGNAMSHRDLSRVRESVLFLWRRTLRGSQHRGQHLRSFSL